MNLAEEFKMPKGFQAAGAHVGLKRKRKDLAIIASLEPSEFACALTTNVVKAAPIIWNQKVDASGKKIKAIVINSGNANSCTGEAGHLHARAMAEKTAHCLMSEPDEILIASTGIIGVPLPIEKVEAGIEFLHDKLGQDDESGKNAAEAIMTTDSFIKVCSIEAEIDGKQVTVSAMAKGSGMIHPNMATMLSFILCDLTIPKPLLQKALLASVQKTYNMISVDGDTSTNDMVAIMANGAAGLEEASESSLQYKFFLGALEKINTYLAKCIAKDGEGATKLVTVTVKGSKNEEEAQKLSKSVVSSNLVKTAMFGGDANWGRIVAALGYGGVKFDLAKVSVEFNTKAGKLSLLNAGEPCIFNETHASELMKDSEIEVLIDLNDGFSRATAWGCDLSYDYVRINGAYRT